MHTDNFIINNSTARQTIKGIAKLLPHFYREAAAAFIVKTINSVDAGALMVAPQQEEVFWVLDLVGKQETNYLETLLASIHIVAQKQIVRLKPKISTKILKK